VVHRIVLIPAQRVEDGDTGRGIGALSELAPSVPLLPRHPPPRKVPSRVISCPLLECLGKLREIHNSRSFLTAFRPLQSSMKSQMRSLVDLRMGFTSIPEEKITKALQLSYRRHESENARR
jgi:hypothetical protein